MLLKCLNKKCSWHGVPVFEELNDYDVDYVKAVCPKCHAFIKMIKRQDVPEKDSVVAVEDSWWVKIKAADVNLQPAYILNKQLSTLKADYAALQAENERLKEIVEEVTGILTEALEREGLMTYVPKWLQD